MPPIHLIGFCTFFRACGGNGSASRTLSVEPVVLIADEAVPALDVSIKAQVLGLLDNACRKHSLAVLFITHHLRGAVQICDRIIVLQDGRLVEQGLIREACANPREPYTRELLAAAPGRVQSSA